MYIPRTGVIRACVIYNLASTQTGTAEDWTQYIRLNNTTDTEIATVGVASAHRVFENYDLNIAVDAGDYIEIKMVTPAWVTNPEGVYDSGYVLIECY